MKYFNLLTVAVIAAALFSVVTALKCYHCSETHFIGSNQTLGDCSKSAWIESDCAGNSTYCLSLTNSDQYKHTTVKRCTTNENECKQQTGNHTCSICNNKDLCNSAPGISKEIGAVMLVTVGAVLMNFIR